MTDLARYGALLKGSEPEENLWGQPRMRSLSDQPLPMPAREYVFLPPRKYRADFCWIEQRLIVEVDGGSWVAGRHTRGAGFEADHARDALAMIHGWRVLRCTPKQVESGVALDWIEQILAAVGSTL